MDRVEMRAPRTRRWTRWGLVLGGALLAAAPAPATAQEEERTCRCVDRNGDEIENCRCLRTPDFDLPLLARGFGFERRAQIGVSIDYAQDERTDRLGARIERVQEGSPAAEAGLQSGDVVVRVDGRSVFDPLEDREAERSIDLDQSVPVQRFARLVGRLEPGDPVELAVSRDGREVTLTVTPEHAANTMMWSSEGVGPGVFRFDAPGEGEGFRLYAPGGGARLRLFADSLGAGGEPFVWARGTDPCLTLRSGQQDHVFFLGGGNCVDGVELVDLNPELGEYFGTDEGVLVAAVAEGSELGLRPGDVLLAVDGREVRDPSHARRVLSSYEGEEELRLRVRRRGEEMEVLGRRR